jgi:hypothetical protein
MTFSIITLDDELYAECHIFIVMLSVIILRVVTPIIMNIPTHSKVIVFWVDIIDFKIIQNILLKVYCVPTTSAGLARVRFFFSFSFLLQPPFTVLMKHTRETVCAIKQSIYS